MESPGARPLRGLAKPSIERAVSQNVQWGWRGSYQGILLPGVKNMSTFPKLDVAKESTGLEGNWPRSLGAWATGTRESRRAPGLPRIAVMRCSHSPAFCLDARRRAASPPLVAPRLRASLRAPSYRRPLVSVRRLRRAFPERALHEAARAGWRDLPPLQPNAARGREDHALAGPRWYQPFRDRGRHVDPLRRLRGGRSGGDGLRTAVPPPARRAAAAVRARTCAPCRVAVLGREPLRPRTVLVEDPTGERWSDGRRYVRYFVTLAELRPADPARDSEPER